MSKATAVEDVRSRADAASSRWSSDEELAALAASGVATIAAGRQDIGGTSGEEVAAFIRFLRDAASWNLRVVWRGQLYAGAAEVLSHLPPPCEAGPRDTDEVVLWCRQHRYGACYWRRGPGYVLVKDARDATAAAHYVIDEEPLLQAFDLLLEPRPIEAVPQSLRDAASELIEEQLALLVDGWAVVLPYRIRIWPIPFVAV